MKTYIRNEVKRRLSDEYEIPVNAIKCSNCEYFDYGDCSKWECELEDDPDESCCRCFEPND